MTTLTTEQIQLNTKSARRLNGNGCYLFRLKNTDTVYYKPKNEGKELVVISVASNIRQLPGYSNVGFKLDDGDKVLIHSKDINLENHHTACISNKVYTVCNNFISVREKSEFSDDRFNFYNVNKNCLTQNANKYFVDWLLGESNLVTPVTKSSILKILAVRRPPNSTIANYANIYYKLDSVGVATVLSLGEQAKDSDGCHTIVADGIYVRLDNDRQCIAIHSLNSDDKLDELMDRIRAEFKPSTDRICYVDEDSANELLIIPRILF